MSWFNWIRNFLESEEDELVIGERTPDWIESFESDLKNWKYPVALRIKNPVIVSGKVPVSLVKIKEPK